MENNAPRQIRIFRSKRVENREELHSLLNEIRPIKSIKIPVSMAYSENEKNKEYLQNLTQTYRKEFYRNSQAWTGGKY